MTIDQTKLQAFVHQAVADLAASMSGVMMRKATNVRSKTMKSSKCIDNLKLVDTQLAVDLHAHGHTSSRARAGARSVNRAIFWRP